MILNDQKIKDSNIIKPFNDDGLQSHSYDCMLSPMFKLQSKEYNGIWHDKNLTDSAKAYPHRLEPGEFALACTQEYITLPADIIGFVQGKSSIGRGGLQIENAGLIDPLFHGQITLELYNASKWPYNLHSGMYICQLYFHQVEPAVIKPYDKFGKYNGQTGPTTAKIT